MNNEYKGMTPYKSEKMASGVYDVKIVKSLYASLQRQVTVKDNETTTFSPELSADYADVTFTVENGADIYINNEYKGSGTWKGSLGSGNYVVECRKENHKPSTSG